MKTAGSIAIGSKNSIRYRGYVYDSETEMYYLNYFETYEELEKAIAQYIHYYNYERYQEGLNNMTPMEYHAYLDAA